MSTRRPARKDPASSSHDVPSQHSSATIKRVSIVLYDGSKLLAAGTLAEALHAANESQAEGSKHVFTYHVNFISACGGTVPCTSSISVWTEPGGEEQFDCVDALLVAGGNGVALALADDAFVG
jgi:hypothetical protein